MKRKTTKQILFERMGINTPQIKENVPGSDLVGDLQNTLYKHGYFPKEENGEIVFLKIDQNEGLFNEWLNKLNSAWNKISLPF
jgi:hypothetical protein